MMEMQELIGWDHFKCGYLAPQWQTAQNYFQYKGSTHDENIRWSSRVVGHLIQYCVDIWKARCVSVHAKKEDEFSLTHEFALQQIKNNLNKK